jgi:peptidoglycan/xylan/chitin deacetylase (PgdA/CDA1 family)
MITHVLTRDPVAALTFDDGPHPLYTPRLLEVLKKHGARATFFMVGEAALRHPDVVRLVASEGHAIGNHSWDHPSFCLISGRERRAQIRACEQVIAPYAARLFRPPYGHHNVGVWLDATRLRYTVVAWNVSARDWRSDDATWMAEQLINQIRPGSVVDLHDSLFNAVAERYFDREPMLTAVNTVLERMSSAFRFVTVPELLRHGRAMRDWLSPPDPEYLSRLVTPSGAGRRYPSSWPH